MDNIPTPEIAEAVSQFSTGLNGAMAVTLPLHIGLLRAEPGENLHGGKTWTELAVKVVNNRRDIARVVQTALRSPANSRPGSLSAAAHEQATRQLGERQQQQHAQVQ